MAHHERGKHLPREKTGAGSAAILPLEALRLRKEPVLSLSKEAIVREVVIVEAVRTPVGRKQGVLSGGGGLGTATIIERLD